ncbi:MAG: type II toxin-antitoxin system prevent-host-death family antitoxin [Thermoleophilia bacterium]|nr:type II toxin-antitoxin system prevent-host-death family antitoxin [Thermoleophilia bacterium]
MMTTSISEAKAKLSALLERVKAGETVTITDRGVPVAQIVPLNGATEVDWDARLERLERQGVIRRPKKKLPPGWLSARPLPKSRKSVLEALLEERRKDTR